MTEIDIEKCRDKFLCLGLQVLPKLLGHFVEGFEHCYTSMLMLPEAMVSRKYSDIRDFLHANEFEIEVLVACDFSRKTFESLKVLDDSLPPKISHHTSMINDLLFSTKAGSVMLVLRDHHRSVADASARLTSLKGSLYPEDRKVNQLRSILGSKSPVFRYVHSPDSCESFLWELGCLSERSATWMPCLKESSGDAGTRQFDAFFSQAYAKSKHNSLNLENSVQAIKCAMHKCRNSTNGASLTTAEKQLDMYVNHGHADWIGLFFSLDRLRIPIDIWDRITVCGHLTQYDWRGDADRIYKTILQPESIYRSFAPQRLLQILTLKGYVGDIYSVERYLESRSGHLPR